MYAIVECPTRVVVYIDSFLFPFHQLHVNRFRKDVTQMVTQLRLSTTQKGTIAIESMAHVLFMN